MAATKSLLFDELAGARIDGAFGVSESCNSCSVSQYAGLQKLTGRKAAFDEGVIDAPLTPC